MNEVEKMYSFAGVAKPVIKKWYYDGYYEDFSWQSSEEDCTKLLKHFDNSIDKLNDRIQQMKKEENANYDRYTDSVMTKFGRIEKAYIDYPPFTAEKQIELIKVIAKGQIGGICIEINVKDTVTISARQDYNRYFEFQEWGSDLPEALAKLINNMWQDLTTEGQEQIREILK